MSGGGVPGAWPYRLTQFRADPGATVIIRLTGALTRTWHLVATGPGWESRPHGHDRRLAAGYAAPDVLVGLTGLAVRDRQRDQMHLLPSAE
jgi:hypothetical protein